MQQIISLATVLIVIFGFLSPMLAQEPSDGSVSSLETAVTSLNEDAAAHWLDRPSLPVQEPFQERELPADERPAPVTVDEVIEAIRNWNRLKVPVEDSTFRVYQEIADTKLLPARSRLYFEDAWRHLDPHDRYEHRTWTVRLDVMTGPNTGRMFLIREQVLDQTLAYGPDEGYSWIVGPMPTSTDQGGSGGAVYWLEENSKGELQLILATLLRSDVQDLRAVVFDADANRFEMTGREVGLEDNMAMFRFVLPASALPIRSAKYVGVEGLSRRGLIVLSAKAVQQAKELGMGVLPLPQVGRRFEFKLAAVDGRELDSSKFHGKVVLIDCWASWCGPCVQQLPELTEVYNKWHDEGLEVIGVSLDEVADAASYVYKSREISWPLVVVLLSKAA